jgi:hypothetical protein
MAYISGTAVSLYDIIENMDTVLVNLGWTQHMHYTSEFQGNTRLVHCIWEGTGDGNEKIYIQAWVDQDTHKKLYLDSCAGYDEELWYWEQPGSIQQWQKKPDAKTTVKQPAFTTTLNEQFAYWIFADTYRIIVVCRMSIIYESFYMGFITPIASERQYPYPMYVAGNTVSNGSDWPNNVQGSFVYPNNGSGFIRRADGTWREMNFPYETMPYNTDGTVFPYNAKNEQLIPNYTEKSIIVQNNFLLIPVLIQTNNPIDVCGCLRNVYWVSGTRDIDAERVLVMNGEQYMVFDTKDKRDDNSYFVIKME